MRLKSKVSNRIIGRVIKALLTTLFGIGWQHEIVPAYCLWLPDERFPEFYLNEEQMITLFSLDTK